MEAFSNNWYKTACIYFWNGTNPAVWQKLFLMFLISIFMSGTWIFLPVPENFLVY